MGQFSRTYEEWMQSHLNGEKNPRRRELLNKGLPHSTVTFLERCWYPAIGNFNHLYPEWEVRDMNNAVRYLDLAYMPPGGAKGCIEIHDYRSHARDISTSRFKDLCKKHSMLVLDDWTLLQVAYLSITEESEYCKKVVMAFIGKFLSVDISTELGWAEAETIRFARRSLHPFPPTKLSRHLRVSERHARRILHGLVEQNLLIVTSGNKRNRTYQLPEDK